MCAGVSVHVCVQGCVCRGRMEEFESMVREVARKK